MDALPCCPAGHEYTPENTVHVRGERRCRACKLAKKRPADAHSQTAAYRVANRQKNRSDRLAYRRGLKGVFS